MDKTKAAYQEGIVSIVVNTALFVLKFWVGLSIGSLAIIADAWHTLSDGLTSIIVVLAAKLSSKKADKEHPFGHGRWEPIAALFIACLLGVIAFEFLQSAIAQLQEKTAVNFGMLAIGVTAFSILVKELMAQYAFYLGRKTGNLSVIADGWHHRSDSLSSIVVLGGIIFAGNFWWADSALAVVGAGALFYAAYEIIRGATDKLLGEMPDKKLIKKITKAVQSVYPAKNLQMHHFHLHNYVSHQELTMHIRLNKNLSIAAGHKIATAIEQIIKNQFGMIATIHVEPLGVKHDKE